MMENHGGELPNVGSAAVEILGKKGEPSFRTRADHVGQISISKLGANLGVRLCKS